LTFCAKRSNFFVFNNETLLLLIMGQADTLHIYNALLLFNSPNCSELRRTWMSRKKLYLVLAVHNHQPVGNLDIVFNQGYEDCYGPLLDVLENRPDTRLTLHYSGPLVEWIESRYPSYFDRMAKLVKRGSIEMLSGGFYEPMLAALDPDDAIGQIKMMNEFLNQRMGTMPRAMWLTERVWDASIPTIMHSAGINATMVDDHAFRLSGVDEDPVTGYWVTERNGTTANIFAIDRNLRYMIPFKEPHDVISYLRSVYDRMRGSNVLVYGDDGEKFGMWPGTKEWVVNQGYLYKLFDALQKEVDWLEVVHLSDAVGLVPARGRIYLPESSYPEMMEWAQPTAAEKKFGSLVNRLKEIGMWDQASQFVKGGVWFNFLAKYTESNLMHKRGIFISNYLKQAYDSGAAPEVLDRARREMFKAQCNCGYWHGLFGGLYLGHLRFAIYEHYAKAETLIDSAIHTDKEWSEISVLDYDADGNDEVVLRNSHGFVVLNAAMGGSIMDFTFKPKSFNFQNLLRRYEEPYHDKVGTGNGKDAGQDQPVSIHDSGDTGEQSLRDLLIYDRYPRFSGYTYILPRPVTPQEYMENRIRSIGEFIFKPFEIVERPADNTGKEMKVTMAADGYLQVNGSPFAITMHKIFTLRQDGTLILTHEITHKGPEIVDIYLGVELNLTILSPGDHVHKLMINRKEIDGFGLSDMTAIDNVNRFGLQDDWRMMRLEVTSGREFTLVSAPIKTVSHSEKGFEATYQGTGFMVTLPMRLVPGAVSSHSLSISPQDLGGQDV